MGPLLRDPKGPLIKDPYQGPLLRHPIKGPTLRGKDKVFISWWEPQNDNVFLGQLSLKGSRSLFGSVWTVRIVFLFIERRLEGSIRKPEISFCFMKTCFSWKRVLYYFSECFSWKLVFSTPKERSGKSGKSMILIVFAIDLQPPFVRTRGGGCKLSVAQVENL